MAVKIKTSTRESKGEGNLPHASFKHGECYDYRPDPDWNDLCRRIGGTNWYGDPLYRVVWGYQHLEWAAGEWTEFTDDGQYRATRVSIKREPKYLDNERFYLEHWKPAYLYGTQEAYDLSNRKLEGGQMVDLCGPYPARGNYESVLMFDYKGEFVRPTMNVIELRIQEHQRFLRHSRWAAIHNQERRAKRKAALRRERADIIGEGFAGFPLTPYASYAGLNVPSSKEKIA